MRWQDWVNTSSHLEAVGNLAAHVHITTSELLRGSYAPGRGIISDLVSPQTFIDCLRMTKRLAMEIKRKEQVCTLSQSVKKYQCYRSMGLVNIYL